MSFYRSLLWWLLLATLGALAWELLAPDLGQVVLRWHGSTITTTVAFALAAWALLTFALWVLWYLIRLPYNAWRNLAQRQARNRLVNGLAALNEGRFARAETLLAKAAQEPEARSVALVAARKAALANDDLILAAGHQTALAEHDLLAAALISAQSLLQQGRAEEVLEVLQPFLEKNSLPPRGHRQRLQALAAGGRAQDALANLVSLPKDQGLTAQEVTRLELSLRRDALDQAGDADGLWQRWSALPPAARAESALVLAFAQRGISLGLEVRVADALVEAIERSWSEPLVAELGRLSGRDLQRQAKLQTWLDAHSTSPALLIALAQSARNLQQFDQAVTYLYRAIAQGTGSDAWEQLGHTFAAQGDDASAQHAYANALRAGRNEAPVASGKLGLREQIAAEAVVELRNEHGLPLLSQ